jgi:hypothetical protein
MIVRCPDHITKHALMLAGLPQQDSRERIMKLLPRGLEYEIETGKQAMAYRASEKGYILTIAKEGVRWPTVYHTIDELLTAMREVQPDMRRWSTIKTTQEGRENDVLHSG